MWLLRILAVGNFPLPRRTGATRYTWVWQPIYIRSNYRPLASNSNVNEPYLTRHHPSVPWPSHLDSAQPRSSSVSHPSARRWSVRAHSPSIRMPDHGRLGTECPLRCETGGWVWFSPWKKVVLPTVNCVSSVVISIAIP